MKTLTRATLGTLAAGALTLGLATPSGAHISGDRSTVPAGGYTSITLTVPHGCDGAPTSAIAVQIPEGILNASPQVVAGWDAEVTETALDEPVESGHGEAQTERVSEITWTAEAGNELPDHYRQVFTIGFQAPEEVGERLFFKVVQTCTEGETPWIEEQAEGDEEPEHPAPFVDVVAAEGDGHGAAAADDEAGGTGDDAPGEEAAGDEAAGDEAAAPVAATTDSSDDGGSDGLAIAGLVLGALGLAAGGTALLRTRGAGSAD